MAPVDRWARLLGSCAQQAETANYHRQPHMHLPVSAAWMDAADRGGVLHWRYFAWIELQASKSSRILFTEVDMAESKGLWFLLGVSVGVLAGVLYAPQAGEQ